MMFQLSNAVSDVPKVCLSFILRTLEVWKRIRNFYDFSYFEEHESEAYGLLYGNENHLLV